MASALIGADACARCAGAVGPGDARCSYCGMRIEPIASGSAVAGAGGPLLGVVPAGAGRLRSAAAIDVLLVCAVTALAAIGLATDRVRTPEVVLAGVVAAIAAIGVLAWLLRGPGTTPGRALLRLRTVDAVSGLRPRGAGQVLLAILSGGGRSTITADLARGRDPQAASVAPHRPVADAQPGAVPIVAAAAPAPVDAPGARLVADSGDEVVVDAPVLIGRAPEPRGGVRAVHALPDLTRGVGRTHLLADWSNGLLWITDLGTAGGTTVRSDAGAFRPLLPEVPTAVAPGWQVRLGGRTLTVRSMAVEEGAARG